MNRGRGDVRISPGGVRTAGRNETMYGEGWGMCGFRQTRSDRRPQWDQGGEGWEKCGFRQEAFGPQAAVVQCTGKERGCADFARGVRTAGRSGSMYGEGKGMCGFRQRRSDRRPQWNHGERGEGEVRISPEAFGPQAAVNQRMGRGRGCADFVIGARINVWGGKRDVRISP